MGERQFSGKINTTGSGDEGSKEKERIRIVERVES